MATTKKPLISQQSIDDNSKIKSTEELIHDYDNYLRELNGEEQLIFQENEKNKTNYYNEIISKQEQVINDFKLRSEREINHYNELLSRVIKKHKTRFGTKEELELLDYSNLLDLYNQDKKSIWNTIKKMLNL